jgi:hypothetical protein
MQNQLLHYANGGFYLWRAIGNSERHKGDKGGAASSAEPHRQLAPKKTLIPRSLIHLKRRFDRCAAKPPCMHSDASLDSVARLINASVCYRIHVFSRCSLMRRVDPSEVTHDQAWVRELLEFDLNNLVVKTKSFSHSSWSGTPLFWGVVDPSRQHQYKRHVNQCSLANRST